MTERCDDLDLFFDRELETEAAEAFRDHLATCTRCKQVLQGRMLEAAVVAKEHVGQVPILPEPGHVLEPAIAAPAAQAPSPDPSRLQAQPQVQVAQVQVQVRVIDELAARRRRPMAAAAAAITAVAAALLIMCPRQRSEPRVAAPEAAAPAIALADARSVDIRFSAPALDHHRNLHVERAAGATGYEHIKVQDLAELDRRGEVTALIGAFALNGDLASAERTANELPRTASGLSDRAALELLRVEGASDPVPGPKQEAAAERALSLTADALRLDPDYAQARWNQAIALSRLGLSLVAARVFDELAGRNEAGWSDEARQRADKLRRDDQRDADDWRRVKDEAGRMVLGGPVLTDRAVARAPSLARDAFYLALATASTRDRLDAFAALARALDAQFATTALGDVLARVRASDLRSRAPFAAELRAFIELHKPAEAINDLRARALQHEVRDVVLASFLAVDVGEFDDADLALLDKLLIHDRDPWWKLIALARRAFVAEFWHRDYPAVDAIERLAAPLCKTTPSRWCERITLFAGGANSQMGRADLAIEQITTARRLAKAAAARDGEVAALDALGEAIAIRVADDIDSAAVAGAYLEEVSLRKDNCQTRLQRLDFAANAALQHHRLDQAAGFRHEADALEQGECRDAELRLNGETARLRLLLRGRGRLDTLRANLARLEAKDRANHRLYLDFLDAAATLVEDRPRGEAALRRVIAAADADPHGTYAPLMRLSAFDVLVESAAGSGSAKAVLALLTERLRTPSFDRCLLGIASWDHLIVAMLDADGNPALEMREIPDGVVTLPPSEVVSPAMRARLAGCRRVDVVAPGPYFGAPKLLGDGVAWVYHTGTPRAARGFDPQHELVVSDVTPPEDLHLPALRTFSGSAQAEVLSGPRATPDNVLAAMKTASLVVIVAHGFTDVNEPTAASLILSSDPQGDYLLTASKVSSVLLSGSPIVVLAGCDAGRVQVSAEPWSLATSFIAAGARVVIAPTEPIPDASASDVFQSLVERIHAGADPVDALVAERSARGAAAAWLSSIVVFE